MVLEIPTAGWVAISLLALCVLILALVAVVWLMALGRLAGELMKLLSSQSQMICAMKNTEAFVAYSNGQQPSPARPEPEERTAY